MKYTHILLDLGTINSVKTKLKRLFHKSSEPRKELTQTVCEHLDWRTDAGSNRVVESHNKLTQTLQ